MSRLPALSAALLLAAAAPVGAAPLYSDESAGRLPQAILTERSMDAALADLDGDGDLDILVASEFRPNILLINDGTGRFSDGSDRLPRSVHDSEDIAIADFDRDGDLDAVIVSEDDETNEYYRNQGDGRFENAGDRLPVAGVTNGLAIGDLDGDGDMDLVLANNGRNVISLNDGAGRFGPADAIPLPDRDDVSQDVSIGDVDRDGDPDLLFGNEGQNRVLLNDGKGRFTDSPDALPANGQISREADLGDVDGDGDLDILEGNVPSRRGGVAVRNRLLLNDGTGRFSDGGDRLPPDTDNAFEADFFDLDGDGDLDIVSTHTTAIGGPGTGRLKAYLNDGAGRFAEATDAVFPVTAVGNVFDVAAGDVNGDGMADLYVANRHGADLLLIRAAKAP